uniref:bile acid:sodium symporter family protein n=1 Tax=Fusobacterium simiae TaxID=855 RepID=UPI003898E423
MKIEEIKISPIVKIISKIEEIFSKYNWLLILVFSVIAFISPEPFLWIVKHTAILLGIAMFGMGTTIQVKDFAQLTKRPKEIMIGCLAQFTIMPLVAWAIATLLDLSTDLALGVILVGCCPGGTASNVITHIAKGDVPLSVSMTITSTIFAPLLTPLWVSLLADRLIDVSFWGMFETVVKIILVPIVLGITVNYIIGKSKNSNIGQKFIDCRALLPIISSNTIITLISGIVASNSNKIVESGSIILGVVAIHNLCGMMLGLLVCKLLKVEYTKSTAIAIEVGMQNSGLAVSLATLNFIANPLATLPGAIFSVWHNISGSIFAGWRRSHSSSLNANIKIN